MPYRSSSAIRLIAVLVVVAATLHGRVAYGETVWDMYVTNAVATTITAKGEVAMIERIEKETDGELKIKFHLAGSLPINVTNITSAVADGVVQLGDDGFFQGNVPIGGLLRLPMLVQTREEFDKALKIALPISGGRLCQEGRDGARRIHLSASGRILATKTYRARGTEGAETARDIARARRIRAPLRRHLGDPWRRRGAGGARPRRYRGRFHGGLRRRLYLARLDQVQLQARPQLF